jgi:hypothetical protein
VKEDTIMYIYVKKSDEILIDEVSVIGVISKIVLTAETDKKAREKKEQDEKRKKIEAGLAKLEEIRVANKPRFG